MVSPLHLVLSRSQWVRSMGSEMGVAGEEQDEELSPEALALGLRVARIVHHMRAEARFNMETFVRACEAQVGGTFVAEAPCARQKRTTLEAQYRSEGFAVVE